MASTKPQADRHKDSTKITVRVSNNLKDMFDTKLELDGKTKNAFLLECIENYVYGKKRD